jgi:pimeloyl-ACP methyl ester carboxylesterase
MYNRRWVIAIPVILFILFSTACSAAPAETTATRQATEIPTAGAIQNVQSTFEKEDCDFQGNELFKGKILCGALVVPEERGNPDSPTLRLRVVVFKSTGDTPPNDPIFITFGPYNAGFTFFFGYSRLWGAYLDKHDLVILDPRGSGRSGLRLDCPELETAYFNTLELDINSLAVKDILVEAHKTCRARGDTLVTSLKNLNIAEMAQDFEDLRLALGYEKVNLQAWGPGTRLAETWAVQHPDSIHTLTVISPIPAEDNIFSDQIQSVDRVIQSIFMECAADKNCGKTFPDLDKVFPQLVADLNVHPVDVEVNYLAEGKEYNMRMNGDRLIDLAFVMATSTYPEWIGFLPQVIYELKAGNTSPAAQVLNTYIDFGRPSGPPFAQGIWCGELLDPDSKSSLKTDIDGAPALYSSYLTHALEINTAVCEIWGARGNGQLTYPSTPLNVPSLFLTSNTDLVAPADVLNGTSKHFTPAFVYEFSGGGGVQSYFWWDCWSKVQTDFMNNPAVPPQEGCIQKTPKITWITFKP